MASPPRPSTARSLILLRHGKSAYPQDVDDHDRPLAPRGRRQAAAIGRWLAESMPPVDRVLCSTATRARQTAAQLALDAPVTFARGLYDASVAELHAQIGLVDATVDTLLVVAHAPGLPALAAALAGTGSEPAAIRELDSGLPTCGVAVLAVGTAWAGLRPGGARLIYAGRPVDD